MFTKSFSVEAFQMLQPGCERVSVTFEPDIV